MRLTELLLKLRRGPIRGESGGEGSMGKRPLDEGRSVDKPIELVLLCPGAFAADAEKPEGRKRVSRDPPSPPAPGAAVGEKKRFVWLGVADGRPVLCDFLGARPVRRASTL